jgi:hypothetical protein
LLALKGNQQNFAEPIDSNRELQYNNGNKGLQEGVSMKILDDGTVQAGLRLLPSINEWCTKMAATQGLPRNAWVTTLILKEYERVEGKPFRNDHVKPA